MTSPLRSLPRLILKKKNYTQAVYVNVNDVNTEVLFTQLLHKNEAQTAVFKDPVRTAL